MTKQQTILTISASISLLICAALFLIFYKRMKQSLQGKLTGNYFSDSELMFSLTAQEKHIDNTPTPEAWQRLYALRDNVLNPAREEYGSRVKINCAYRSPALNTAVKGVKNSQHLTGEAADITTKTHKGNKALFAILVKQHNYDQLIWEGNGAWIHVSYAFNGNNRRQILAQDTTNPKKYHNITNNYQTAIA